MSQKRMSQKPNQELEVCPLLCIIILFINPKTIKLWTKSSKKLSNRYATLALEKGF
jgi:hypothetical protein